MKKISTLIITIALIVGIMFSVGCGNSSGAYKKALDATSQNMAQTLIEPGTGAIGGEWAVIGLKQSGAKVSDDFYSKYIENTEKYLIEKKGILHSNTGYKYTEYSRTILGITAAGGDVTNVGGYNLLESLTDMDNITRQGINGPIWALIAFDSGNYEIPKNSHEKNQATREKLIKAILTAQLIDGGWDFAGDSADADMTAMALTALSPYYNKDNKLVDKAVEEGLNAISNLQGDNGGFVSMGSPSSESCSQVIVALSSLGIDCDTDERFVRDDNSVLDGLLSYYDNEGGFYHTEGEEKANQMATEQACYALTAYDRFKNGKASLFNLIER